MYQLGGHGHWRELANIEQKLQFKRQEYKKKTVTQHLATIHSPYTFCMMLCDYTRTHTHTHRATRKYMRTYTHIKKKEKRHTSKSLCDFLYIKNNINNLYNVAGEIFNFIVMKRWRKQNVCTLGAHGFLYYFLFFNVFNMESCNDDICIQYTIL